MGGCLKVVGALALGAAGLFVLLAAIGSGARDTPTVGRGIANPTSSPNDVRQRYLETLPRVTRGGQLATIAQICGSPKPQVDAAFDRITAMIGAARLDPPHHRMALDLMVGSVNVGGDMWREKRSPWGCAEAKRLLPRVGVDFPR